MAAFVRNKLMMIGREKTLYI